MDFEEKKKIIPLITGFPSAQRFSFFLLAIILVLFILIQAKLFLYPIAVALLLAYMLYPITNFLEKHKFPRILAVFISLVFLLAVIGAIGTFIYKNVEGFLDDFPAFRSKALNNIDIMESWLEQFFGGIDFSIADALKDRVAGLFDAGSDFLKRAFTATTGTIFRLGIVPVFIFLFLYYRTKFAYFILKLVSLEKQPVALNVLRGLSKVASRYMGGMLTIVLVLCTVNSTAFYFIGLKHSLIFGVIAGSWSFIPYFGTIVGYSIPFIFVLLTGDSPDMAIKVLITYLVVHFTENNVLTPNILGNYVKINAFVIIIGMIAAGMVWGLPGMFVIVPFIAMVKVICEHVDSLHAYVYLLGTTGMRRHALTAENIRKFIHRLKKK